MQKEKKELIENCVALHLSKLDNGQKNGTITLSDGNRDIVVKYEKAANGFALMFDNKEQYIEIEELPAFNGHKQYFLCDCGKRCKILYLRTDRELLGCRKCNNLAYVSTRMSRRTVNGKILSDFDRITKLMNRREALQSIFYRGRPTRKFLKLKSDAEKYGFGDFFMSECNGIQQIKLMEQVVNSARNI